MYVVQLTLPPIPNYPTSYSPDETPLIVPHEKILGRAVRSFLWQRNLPPVQREVLLAVLEVGLERLLTSTRYSGVTVM